MTRSALLRAATVVAAKGGLIGDITARKQRHSPYAAMRMLHAGTPWMPATAGTC